MIPGFPATVRRLLCAALLLCAAGCYPDRIPDIKSPDPYARALAVLDLAQAELTDEVRQILNDSLSDPHPLVRDSAMITISDLGLTNYAPKITARIADPAEEVRVRACITLGEMRDASTIPSLAQALAGDSSPRVRRRAAYALAEFGPAREVLEALVEGVGDGDASVRHACHLALVDLTRRADVPKNRESWKKALMPEEKGPAPGSQ